MLGKSTFFIPSVRYVYIAAPVPNREVAGYVSLSGIVGARMGARMGANTTDSSSLARLYARGLRGGGWCAVIDEGHGPSLPKEALPDALLPTMLCADVGWGRADDSDVLRYCGIEGCGADSRGFEDRGNEGCDREILRGKP